MNIQAVPRTTCRVMQAGGQSVVDRRIYQEREL